VLRHLPQVADPDLILGSNPADDAAVYRVRDDLALVQTVDYFTPIVDDPFVYGQIAAANSLSDVYAVGGAPITALNIVGFPVKTLSLGILSEILRGGAAKASEAGIPIVGGHTVDDEEPKYGLAVTGTVDPEKMVTPRAAQPGDLLVLTKPVGTGTISTALKSGIALPEATGEAARWMMTLNRDASRAMVAAGARAATDVTGFGLLGHLADLCAASGVSAVISFSSVPLLPFALKYIRAGSVPGGTLTNLEAAREYADLSAVDEDARLVLADPQTSGGLLISLHPSSLPAFRRASTGDVLASVVGRVEDGPAGRVSVHP
jgi:selenide,water dikinase